MFGLNFIQSGFLMAGVLATTIPIAIHLLLRQRARRMDIGSVRFLQRVIREQNRMRRIRQWLLLAARILTVLLLALLFARPFWDQTAFDAAQREVVYLMDRSASMQLGAHQTLLERAHHELLVELDQIHENTIVRVAVFDSQDVSQLDWDERHRVPNAGYSGTDYGKAICWARDVLMQSSRPDRTIVLYSDMQKSGMERTPVDTFPTDIHLRIRDWGRTMANNVSVASVRAVATEIRPKMPPLIDVELRNHAPTDVPVAVTLHLQQPDGTSWERTETVSLEGAGREMTTFAIDDAMPGIYQGYAVIQFSDELDFDNRRYVALEVRHPDRVLLVDGQEGDSVYGDETYYLEKALRVGQEYSTDALPSFEVERLIWNNGRGFPRLEGFKVVVLANVGNFTREDAQRLRGYLDRGGRVFIACGDQFTRRAVQPMIDFGIIASEFLGDANLGPYPMSHWDAEHPVFQPFRDPQSGDLRRLRSSRIAYFKISPQTRALATSSQDEPLLFEREVGQGMVLIWTSTVDTAWTSFPRSRLYVPLTRQLFAYLTDQHVREARIEDKLATDEPGITNNDGHLIVRNVAAEESNLARVTPEEFRQAYGLPEKRNMADLSPEEKELLAPPANGERPAEVWRMIGLILFGWLLVETFCAGRVHG